MSPHQAGPPLCTPLLIRGGVLSSHMPSYVTLHPLHPSHTPRRCHLSKLSYVTLHPLHPLTPPHRCHLSKLGDVHDAEPFQLGLLGALLGLLLALALTLPLALALTLALALALTLVL